MSSLRHVEQCIANQQAFKALNAFIPQTTGHGCALEAARRIDQATIPNQKASPLRGRLIAVKDNICTLGGPTTCGSKILKGFRSPFNAHVVNRLEDAGAILTGKTNLDEFGMGSHSTHSIFGAVHNFRAEDGKPLSAGGSSGGSAVAVATDQCWAALGTDTGGSVRLPATYTGVVGFKPSYGLVSRYGVIAYANSLDTVGVLASKSTIAKQVFDQIRGPDNRDPTSISSGTLQRIDKLITARDYQADGQSLRIGVPSEYNIAELEPIVRATWLKAIQSLEGKGHLVLPVSLPATKLALSAYYVIAPAEASSNLAKYDGVRYGNPASENEFPGNVLYATTRGEGLGDEVRKRILLGAYSLSASALDNYFLQAQRVRRLVQQDFDHVFALQNPLSSQHTQASEASRVDILLTPTAPSLPPTLASLANRSSVDTYRDDVLTVPASLAGLPAMSVPIPIDFEKAGVDPIAAGSIGLQIIAQYGDDDLVFRVAEVLEQINQH